MKTKNGDTVSGRKRGRLLTAKLLALLMILNTFTFFIPGAVKADEVEPVLDETFGFLRNEEVFNNGKITVKQSVDEDSYSDGDFDVKVEIADNPPPADIVIVTDRSTSMGKPVEASRMSFLKLALQKFVRKLLMDEGEYNVMDGKYRVGLVDFAGVYRSNINRIAKSNWDTDPDYIEGRSPIVSHISLNDDTDYLCKKIDKYEAASGRTSGSIFRGAAFTQAGLIRAEELFRENTEGRLNKENNNRKIIILLTDGDPTVSFRGAQEFESMVGREKLYVNDDLTYKLPVTLTTFMDKKKYYCGNGQRTLWRNDDLFSTVDYTIRQADYIKEKFGVEFYTVGIDLFDNEETWTRKDGSGDYKEGEKVVEKVASSPDHCFKVKAAEIETALDDIYSKIVTKRANASDNVEDGVLEIKMNDKVDFKSLNKKGKIKHLSISAKNTDNLTKYSTEKDLKKRVKNIKASWNSQEKILTLKNITIKTNEIFTIKYRAQLKRVWRNGNPVPINEKTILHPYGTVPAKKQFVPRKSKGKGQRGGVHKKNKPNKQNEQKDIDPKKLAMEYSLTVPSVWDKDYGEGDDDEEGKKTYVVSFDGRGFENLTPIEVEEGKTISEPELSENTLKKLRFGYDIYWVEPDGPYDSGEPFDFKNTPITRNILLRFVYKRRMHTVSFNANTVDGGVSLENPPAQTLEEGYTSVNRPEDPVLSGYAFKGWYLEGDSEPFNFKIYDLQKDITLNAKWEKVTQYTVTFDAGKEPPEHGKRPIRGGNGKRISFSNYVVDMPSPQIVDEGMKAVRPEVSPRHRTSDKIKFIGWYYQGVEFDFENTPITGDITVQAVWRRVE
ncbi:MAG: InlB B-repeat-containing protein [Catonella sp.]